MSADPLPVDEILEPLLRALRSAQAVVVEAPPGAGKTTRIPRALLEAGLGAEREIWVTEPRRVAARLAADFVARQLGETVGQRVGYRVRFEQRGGPDTRLRFVTDGVLLERLSSPERGTGIGVVVLDEFHERHIATDLNLMLLRRRLGSDAGLRIIVMSATLDAEAVAAYLGGCPRLRSTGRVFPVEIEHDAASEEERPLPLRVSSAVKRLVRAAPRGNVLTFLPGAGEIERAKEALQAFSEEQQLDLVTLHGELPLELQARAIAEGPRRKVVLATNVAESSITVEGVTAVVDSGLARIAEYSPWTDRQSLEVRPIARASATQRAGRAGRTEPGHVVRLYTEASLRARPEQEKPELQRLDLTGPLLTLYGCKVAITPEIWLDAPSDAALEGARAMLERLGLALGGRVTALGRRALALPVPPRLARIALEGAELGIPRRACLAVALLAERDIRHNAAAAERGLGMIGCECDVDQLIELYTAAEAERFHASALRKLGLHPGRVDTVRRSYEQLLRNVTARQPLAREEELGPDSTRRALGLALLTGFPDRVARRREPGKTELILSTGHVAQLVPESVARNSPLLLAVEAEDRVGAVERGRGAPRSQLRVRLASPIEAEWLIDHAPEGLSERELLDWDDEREKAILITQLCWGAVVLEQSTRPAYPGIATGALVERAALGQLANLFGKAETLPELVARSELVAQYQPQLGLQRVNDLGTRGLLHAACQRVISLAELRELDWRSVFIEQLTPEQARELDRQAPEYVVLKGGRRVRVQYARGQAPFIESRLQDFFGMLEGPSVAGGRLPLTLHLLAPNQRAVQVTTDLAGFWERHYAGLRRELSRRYPRHAWPEEPRTATAPPPNKPR